MNGWAGHRRTSGHGQYARGPAPAGARLVVSSSSSWRDETTLCPASEACYSLPLVLSSAARLGLWWRAWRYRLRLDRREINYLLRHLSTGQCAVDVGAHKGAYTYWLQRAVGPHGRVFAFEPQPELADRLRATLAASGVTHVRVENLGLSDRCGSAVLVQPPGSTCSATLEKRSGIHSSRTVQVVTLDSYFQASNARIALLKCDVEGHELAVFRGATRILREHRPLLMFECEARHLTHGSVFDVFRLLEHEGYQGWFFWKRALCPVSELRPELHQVPGRTPYVNNFIFAVRRRPA